MTTATERRRQNKSEAKINIKHREARCILTNTEKRLSEIYGHPVYLSINMHHREAVILRRDGSMRRVTYAKVKEAVSKHYGITLEQLTGRSKLRSITKAKGMYCYLCYRIYAIGHSKEVGLAIGLINHTSVLHHVHQTAGYVQLYKEMELDVAEIRAEIEEGVL